MILHLLGNVVEERTPLGSRTELRNVVGGHVNSFVGDHDHSGSRKMVEVVEVRWRSEGGKVGCWLRGNERRSHREEEKGREVSG